MKKLKKEDWKKIKEGVKEGVRSGYLREMFKSFSPKSYSHLATNSVWHGIKYLLIIMMIAFLLMAVISIPSLFGMPSAITAQLDKFEKLNFTADIEMNSPVMFTESDPQIIIDTTGQTMNMTTEKVLITDDFLAYRPYNKMVKINMSELREVTNYKEDMSNMITFLIVLVIPSLLITLYMIHLIKYAVLILAMTIIVFIFSRLIKKDVGLRKSLMVAVYASTIMVVIEVLFMPFSSIYLLPMLQILGVNFYFLTLLLYLFLALFAVYFASRGPKKEKGYVEVEEVQWDF